MLFWLIIAVVTSTDCCIRVVLSHVPVFRYTIRNFRIRKTQAQQKMAHSTGGVIVKYVRHKVSVVRWRPASQGSLQEPDVFVTGSWDNGVSNISTT